jgi:purine nucleosidase/pyrimidine-specific ribonucleoside hydrolase
MPSPEAPEIHIKPLGSKSVQTPVLIDCDPGIDDAIALLLALASPELDVLGVTTVAGNQTLEKTTANALRVLELAGRPEVPVAAGADRPLVGELMTAADAHGESGLGGNLPLPTGRALELHAVDFLAEQALASPHPVTLVPLGPLTNVALLIARHPDAAARLDRLVLMGGAISAGNVTPSAEYNIWIDPEAAARVFQSGLDVTMIGLDVTNRAVLTPEHLHVLGGGGRIGAAVAELVDSYQRFYLGMYDFGGAPVHDAVAIAHVIRSDLVHVQPRHVAVELAPGLCRGRTVVDTRRRITDRPEANALVADDIDAPAFVEFLLERLRSLTSDAMAAPGPQSSAPG